MGRVIPERVDTAEGPVFLATVEDLFSRRTGGLRPGLTVIPQQNSPLG